MKTSGASFRYVPLDLDVLRLALGRILFEVGLR